MGTPSLAPVRRARPGLTVAAILGAAVAVSVAAGVQPPTEKKATPTDPFVISTDAALHGKRVSRQIPAIARVGRRWFCIWYGVNAGEPGTSGEGTGCYNTLAVSDDDCETWREVAYFVPNPKAEAQSVIDPRMVAVPDGRLLVLIPVTGQKGRTRSVWSVVLKNPTAKGEPLAFGPPTFIDYGFVGSAAPVGDNLYFTANQNASGPPPWPETAGMKLHRVTSLADDRVRTELVGRLPYAAGDGSLNTFFEVSLAEAKKGELLACFRTTGEQHLTRSADGGKTWTEPKPFAAHPNAKGTKADLARSPSGRLVPAFNRGAGRVNMCVALSDDGGETWPHHYVFDDRTNPGTSYPNVAFGAGTDGKYDGNIYVAYDHGRGKLKPDFTKEITVAKIPEAGVAGGKPTSTRYVVSK